MAAIVRLLRAMARATVFNALLGLPWALLTLTCCGLMMIEWSGGEWKRGGGGSWRGGRGGAGGDGSGDGGGDGVG